MIILCITKDSNEMTYQLDMGPIWINLLTLLQEVSLRILYFIDSFERNPLKQFVNNNKVNLLFTMAQ